MQKYSNSAQFYKIMSPNQ